MLSCQKNDRQTLSDFGVENATLAAIVESSDDAIISKTLDGIITTWNAAAERIFGYDADEAIGQHMVMLLPPDRLDEEATILAKLSRGERIDHFETVRVAKNGRLLNVSVTSSPVRNSLGEIVGASKIARDITAQKRTEAAIRWQQSAMEHLARLNTMGEMAAGLAHELNQPLACILTYAGVSLDGIQAGTITSSGIASALEKVVGEARRAGEIIRRLRNFIAKRDPSFEEVDVNLLVHDAAQLLEHDLRHSEITLMLKLGEDLPRVLADPIQVVQVLVNLLRNARDAMVDPGAGGKELTVVSSVAGRQLHVDVIDRGCGVTPEQMDRLFDRFFSTKAVGLGMGLAISKTIMNSLGGRLTAAMNPQGGGMTFRITLPIREQ
jgi:PAS domain S-box-containing protein